MGCWHNKKEPPYLRGLSTNPKSIKVIVTNISSQILTEHGPSATRILLGLNLPFLEVLYYGALRQT